MEFYDNVNQLELKIVKMEQGGNSTLNNLLSYNKPETLVPNTCTVNDNNLLLSQTHWILNVLYFRAL